MKDILNFIKKLYLNFISFFYLSNNLVAATTGGQTVSVGNPPSPKPQTKTKGEEESPNKPSDQSSTSRKHHSNTNKKETRNEPDKTDNEGDSKQSIQRAPEEQQLTSSPNHNKITLVNPELLKSKIFWVEYDAFYHKLDYSFYPTVLIPKKGTIIKPPQKGRSGNIGVSEKKFLSYVSKHFAKVFHVSNDMSLFVRGKDMPYEPDITLWNIIDDKLICIDIEIDEPYAGGTNELTHCKGYDVERNKDFLNRGWTVIRFSENQVVEYPERCCKVIADVVAEIVDTYTVPKELTKEKKLIKEEYWDETRSEELAKNKTREKLLNIPNFGNVEEQTPDYTAKDHFTHLEEKVEDQYSEFDSLIKRKKKKRTSGTYGGPLTQDLPVDDGHLKKKTNHETSQEDELEEKLDRIKKGREGVDKSGRLSTITTAKPVKPTRHYGGKLDKRISELMKPKRRPFSLALLQKNYIEKDFDFLKCRIEQGKLICTGKVQPEFCAEYELKIEYEEGFAPRVFITKPEIKPENKIHMYSDGSLCLYYPNDFTWRDNMNIADYFIPWAIEWIYCYEYYLLTGEWKHEEAPGHEIVDYESKLKKKAS
jgi:hypothetical protein